MKLTKLFFIVVFLFSCTLTFAQTKAEKAFQKAIALYENSDLQGALKQLDNYLKISPNAADGYVLRGDIFSDMKMNKDAIDAYSKALQLDSVSFPSLYYILGNQYFSQAKYVEAKRLYKKYLASHPSNAEEKKKVEENLPLCDYRMDLVSNAQKITLKNLGDSINTSGYEFVNAISLDDKSLYYTHRDVMEGSDEDFYVASFDTTTKIWQKPVELGEPFNTKGNEGAMCVSADGNVIIFTACNRPDSYGGCDLYISSKVGDRWTTPQNLGNEVNSTAWESQPFLSSDGKTLYFVSNRAGGCGGADIWKSTLQFSGIWGKPQNLGKVINTSGDEFSPFLHPDQKTLYFSSTGHKGLGGADIFISRLDKNKQWTKPQNLGSPVNSNKEEINLIVDAKGNKGYLSVEREEGKGKTDIYDFTLPPFMQPVKTSYIKGKVFDKNTKEPLRAALELINLHDKETEVQTVSDKDKGTFMMSLPLDRDYALNVNCDGYLFYSLHFSMPDNMDKESEKYFDIALEPVKVGSTAVLKNIFFDTDKFDLLPKSIAELQKLRDFLKRNASISIEIGGHTDRDGNDERNITLSQNRAKAVYDYLIKEGIEPARLFYKGFGKTQPIDTNDTAEGKANNRRTEFKIVKK